MSIDATPNPFLTSQIETASTQLDAELKKDSTNFEELFELVCRIQILMARLSGQDIRDYNKELTVELAKNVELQRSTFGSYASIGMKGSAALIQLGGALAGIRGFQAGNQALSGLAMPISYAGQGIGGIASTNDERNQSPRLKYQHEAEEAKRRRDEATGTKSRTSQNVQELQQIYQRAIESANRAKTAAVAA